MKKKSTNQLWRKKMNKNFWKDLKFEFKEWKRRRRKKKEYKSHTEIAQTRSKKSEFDAYQDEVQRMVSREFKN